MSLTFKLLSLAIRTAAKPIGNYIKRQAKEHDGFRRFAVSQAQRVHRIDMRMRLGILHDPVAQDRMHEREQKAAEEKRRKAETPIVRTEAEQKKFDEEQARTEKEGGAKKEDSKTPRVKIRPLSEAKAIDLGANFFSEAFIFGVAAGLLVWDAWRSRKKESARRDDVKERLEALEVEVSRLYSKYEPGLEPVFEKPKPERTTAWYNPAGWWTRVESVSAAGEEDGAKTIAGNVPGPDKSASVKVTTSKENEEVQQTVKQSKKSPAEPPPSASAVVRVDSVTAKSKEW